jgi:hypothetical protein
MAWKVGVMAAVTDDVVLRLLCHLAWLRDMVGGSSKQSSLKWARRVYNAAAHLQFRFVYPHQPHDRVAESAQPLLAKTIEAVVDVASETIEPLRSGFVADDSVLDAVATSELRDVVTVLLDTAAQIGWGGTHAPKEDTTLDRPVNPVKLLAEWRRRHGANKQAGPHSGSNSTAHDEAMEELYKGIATKIVAEHSRVMARVPASASELFHTVADAYLSVDLDECSRAGGDQLLQRFAAQMLRDSARRAR